VTPSSRRRSAAAALASLLLAACGSGDSKATTNLGSVTAVDSAGVQTATIDGTDGLRFSPGTVNAKPGAIALTLKVTGGVPHNLEVKGIPGASIPNVAGHESKTLRFTATPGTYQLICTYHSGMRGSLVVAP
jgi:plastocyanin